MLKRETIQKQSKHTTTNMSNDKRAQIPKSNETAMDAFDDDCQAIFPQVIFKSRHVCLNCCEKMSNRGLHPGFLALDEYNFR
jgi:hypothetical protein